MIAAIVLAAYAGTLELSDATNVNLRTMTATQTGVDIALAPAANVKVTDRRWEFAASYAPFFYWTDLEQGSQAPSPILFNNGSLLAAWHNRLVRVSLDEAASYGFQNTAYLGLPPPQAAGTVGRPGPPPPVIQLVPQQQVILKMLSSRTTLAADVHPSRRLELTIRSGYYVFGGTDAPSQAVLPRQEGPFGAASAIYYLSHRDVLLVNAAGTGNQTGRAPCQNFLFNTGTIAPGSTCAPDDFIGNGTVGLSHNLTRATNATVTAGASVLHWRLDPSIPYSTKVYPSGLASLQYRFGYEENPTTFRVDAQVGPVIDVRTGLADYRAQGNLGLTHTIGHLILMELAGTTRSLTSVQVPPSTYLVTTTSAEYAVSRNLFFAGLFNLLYENQDGAGSFVSTLATLSVIVRSSALHF
jgi:hypothetical protein